MKIFDFFDFRKKIEKILFSKKFFDREKNKKYFFYIKTFLRHNSMAPTLGVPPFACGSEKDKITNGPPTLFLFCYVFERTHDMPS